ncbi:unannotated protein [freshwater metagenome]|uniref:Unannotated protein n=1 Tax=freshwater metagenome TaxID=449393 RepID=A0A6J7S779_9ZZZZ
MFGYFSLGPLGKEVLRALSKDLCSPPDEEIQLAVLRSRYCNLVCKIRFLEPVIGNKLIRAYRLNPKERQVKTHRIWVVGVQR